MRLPDMGDSNNWIAATAVIALTISIGSIIAPKIWAWARPKKVIVSSGDSFGMTHHLGRAYLILPVRVENDGPNSVSIAKLQCVLVRHSSDDLQKSKKWLMPAKTYFSAVHISSFSGGPMRMHVGTIRLEPNQSWEEVVVCYGSRDEEVERQAQLIQDEIGREIARVLEKRARSGNDSNEWPEVEKVYEVKARKFAMQMFDFSQGRYSLYIVALDGERNALGAIKYQFILYQSALNILLDLMADYKYGFGVLDGRMNPFKTGLIQPYLEVVDQGDRVRREYHNLLHNR